MANRPSYRWARRGIAAAALGATILSALPAGAAPWSGNRTRFAEERFERVWRDADLAVQEGRTNRSWTWGPGPWFDYKEFYRQSPNGLRQVQYFDKARMEINNPSTTSGPLGGVTNGLLPVELISGRVKLGDATNEEENEQRTAAQIPVAGDPARTNPDAPTYASFRNIATTDNGYRDPSKLGQRVGTTYDKNGTIGFRQDLADTPGTEIAVYETVTGHNVPRVFNDFRNAGPVAAIAAFGYPITDAYWIKARVAGQEKDVMVQIFERRVLTFTPSNPQQFQVEMGNVGQHYFQWRYAHLGTPWDGRDPSLVVTFNSNRQSPGHLEVFSTDLTGTSQVKVTEGGTESLAFSVLRSWDQKQVRIIGDSKRETGKRQLFSYSQDGSEQRRIHTSTANDYNGSASPDGTKIAFVSDRDGNPELYLLNLSGGGVDQLTQTAAPCAFEYPTWYPDGSGLVYSTNCITGSAGNWEIGRAGLRYAQDKGNDLQAELVGGTNLSNNPAEDRYPRISPSFTHIAFQSNRDGNGEIYVIGFAGGAPRRLTTSSGGDDGAPTWSPDGTQIVYESNVEGDYELYIRNFDGTGERKLTDNGADDRMPIFAQ